METTRLSTKGQIVLPKSIRTSKAWKPGMELTVEETLEGIVVKPATNAFEIPRLSAEQFEEAMRPIREEIAKKKRKGKGPVTLAEMDAGIAAAVAKRYARNRH